MKVLCRSEFFQRLSDIETVMKTVGERTVPSEAPLENNRSNDRTQPQEWFVVYNEK